MLPCTIFSADIYTSTLMICVHYNTCSMFHVIYIISPRYGLTNVSVKKLCLKIV